MLQSKLLLFKEILDQIYSQHDVEQDDLVFATHSPHTPPTEIKWRGASDDIRDNETQFLLELISDDEFHELVNHQYPVLENKHGIPSRTSRSSLRVLKTTTSCKNRRRINFETQVQTGFKHLEEPRTGLLDVLRSRQNPKATFGDILVVLETLSVEPMGKFWWTTIKLLMN